jgi:S1-C subfamily serine protease
MNIIDVLIILFIISSLFRGNEIGFVRQAFSTVGFFGGLLLGALIEPYTSAQASSELSKSIVTICTTLGMALLVMAIGEFVGERLKHRIKLGPANKIDNNLGSVLAAVSLLLLVWLSASIFASLPYPGFQAAINNSRIVNTLERVLPPAPPVIARLSTLIDPNGFPKVFTGQEPPPSSTVDQPSLNGFQAAIAKVRPSVVKLEGRGCGGIVEGSGFVVGKDLIATNAHVVAGITKPYVLDDNGTHTATPVWFDPDLDFAVLRVNNLAGSALEFNTATQDTGTAAAVLGYPGGGGFQADSAAILDRFTATGRNIYGSGQTARDIYEVQADIIPGNSGGPLITKDGKVIGVVFAESTNYRNIGYALTAEKVVSEIHDAAQRTTRVSTGNCAE